MFPSLCSRTLRVSKSFVSSQISPVNRGFSTEAALKDNFKTATQYFQKLDTNPTDTQLGEFLKEKPEVLEAISFLNAHKESLIKSDVLLDHIYNIPITKRKEPVRVAVTGAAGAIGYSLIFRIASGGLFGRDQPVHLSLLELPQAISALKGVVMELEDGAFPLVSGITATSFPEEAFEGAQYVFLVGASPRKAGQERSDLLKANAQIFQIQGKALDKSANKQNLKVLVVGNPANTNALIAAHNAPSLDPKSFSAMTRLDHNRGLAQLSDKLKVSVNNIKDFAIWGNHSSTQYPDISFTKVDGKPVKGLVDDNWVRNEFIPTVQQRGAAIIKARGASSAASAASSAIDHMRDWQLGTNAQWTSMAIYTPQPLYGASKDLYFSFPLVCEGGNYKVVEGLKLDEFSVQKIKETNKELESERDAVKEFLKK